MVDKHPSLRVILFSLSVQFLVFAASEPVIERPTAVRKGAVDVIALFDVSKSMSAQDFGDYSRLDRAKELVLDLLPALNENRLGLIMYAGDSFEQTRPTSDYTSLKFVIENWVTIDATRKTGSRPVLGIQAALRTFAEDSGDREKILVILSDGGGFGENNQIWDGVKKEEVRTILVGLGSIDGYPIKRNPEGDTAISKLDRDILLEMARKADGMYLNGNDGNLKLRGHIITKRFLGKASLEGKESIAIVPLLGSLLFFTIGLFL